MADRNFGDLVRSQRLSTIDESTARPLTQGRLAEIVTQEVGQALGISRSWINELERNRIGQPAPPYVNALCRILQLDPIQALRSLGFDLGPDPLRADERELLAAYRRLRASPALQQTALRVVRALPPPPSRQSRTPRAAEAPEDRYRA